MYHGNEILVALVVVVGFILFVIGAGIYVIYYHLRNYLSKPTTMRAKVMHKRTRPNDLLTDEVVCIVTFDIGGKLMHMVVPQGAFYSMNEGDEGLLVYQGEQFKSFAPNIGWQRS
jgi:hypothetical protein